MKKILSALLLALLIINIEPAFAQDLPNISGRVFVQNKGWQEVHSDENHHLILGSLGEGLQMEAFELRVDTPGLGIQYMSNVAGMGWQGDRNDGALSGTEGQGTRIEGVTIRLIGEAAPNYKLYYRTHVQNYGWLDWATEYAATGTINHNYRCEAVEIVIYPNGTPAPGSTRTPCIMANSVNESKHIHLVNTYRRSRGVSYVTGDPALLNVAQHRVNELSSRFSHIRPNGLPYETIVKDVYPNYNGRGGAIIENISLARTPLMTQPEYAFDYLSTYQHQLDIVANPDARYVAWTAISTPRMGYSIELFSGLDRINFGD